MCMWVDGVQRLTLYGKNVQYLLYSMYIMGGKSNVKQKAAECSIILLFE